MTYANKSIDAIRSARDDPDRALPDIEECVSPEKNMMHNLMQTLLYLAQVSQETLSFITSPGLLLGAISYIWMQ